MRSALMLCYFFPPLGGGGVQRSAKFVKYLPGLGWLPAVVSVEPNARNIIEQGMDRGDLSRETAAATVVRPVATELGRVYTLLHRIRARRLLLQAERWLPFASTDHKIGWFLPALRSAESLMRSTCAEMVYSSSPPYAAHMVARRIQRAFGVPWVADFRDPWTEGEAYRPASPAHAWLDRRVEATWLREADAIVANTERNRRNLIETFGVPAAKVHVIPNGFDPSDFRPITTAPPARFTISCVGKFYEMDPPEAFFRAYRRFAEQHPGALLCLVGTRSRAIQRLARRELPPEAWLERDQLHHEDAVRTMQDSSILLANLPSARAGHWVPGKLYEYLASGRPILFIGPPDGDAAEILRTTRAGVTVSNTEDAIYAALVEYHRAWQQGFPNWSPDAELIADFDRRQQTRALADIFDGLTASSPVANAMPEGAEV